MGVGWPGTLEDGRWLSRWSRKESGVEPFSRVLILLEFLETGGAGILMLGEAV